MRIQNLIALSIILFFSLAAPCLALDVTLAWNACTGATGYKIYYDTDYMASGPPYNGTGAYEGPSPIDVGSTTQFTIHDLPDAGYRFALTAYNDFGESGFSPDIVLPPQHTLSVGITGQGSITPPGGNYSENTAVQLTAIPDSGWVFSGWSGDLNASTNPATIIMDADKTVTANFTQLPNMYTLSVDTTGLGSVNPPGGNYSENAGVQLTAVPDSGWVFNGWSGGLGGNSNPATVTMNSNKYVLAIFSQVSPVINTFASTPETISDGESAMLLWDILRANSASIDNGIGSVDPIRGSAQVAPLSTTIYTITATNDAGSDTAAVTVKVGPRIVDIIPHDGAGIQDNIRIPNNASFAAQIVDMEGIDTTDPDNIRFTIYDGNNIFERNLDDTSVVTVTKLLDEPDNQVTELWVAYHRAAEPTLGNYAFDTEIHIEVDIRSAVEGRMIQASYEFKTETQAQHEEALANSPDTRLIPPDDITIEGYDAGIQVASGDIRGAKIIYDSSGPVTPKFGPIDEMPSRLDSKNTIFIGAPLNLQPPTVFCTPVTLYIPCPGYTEVSNLSVFLFNGTDWVMACDAGDNVEPDGESWMLPDSRVNHNDGDPSTIEIKVYHFSGAWAAKVKDTGWGKRGRKK